MSAGLAPCLITGAANLVGVFLLVDMVGEREEGASCWDGRWRGKSLYYKQRGKEAVAALSGFQFAIGLG